MSYIFGRKPIIESLRSGTTISKIFLQFGTHGIEIEEIKQLAKSKSVIVSEIDKFKCDQIAGGELTQGVIAQISEKKISSVDEIISSAKNKNENPFILIFDEIEDPHNLGALIRSGVCFGAHGGILPKHHSATITPTVVKTSAGAIEHFTVAQVTNIAQEIEKLKKENIWVVGTDSNAEKNFTEIDFTCPIAIVIGNEGKGMRRLVKEKCDFLVKIPMTKKFDSLNVSVAGAIVMSEVFRQRNKK
ncbi:MAG: 23S rRNA (guanosine(2251)-2'-O)-methyltransferase RlmB [Bacteroidota bacterium]